MSAVTAPAAISSRYDEVSPKYNQGPQQVALKLFWHVYEHLTWSAVEKVLPGDGRALRVLDAGGGGGSRYSTLFAERGHHVTVLDLSPGMLEQARASFTRAGLLERAGFVVGNVLELPFADASFDLVFCEGDPVSYCLDEYPRAIRELVRVVVPGGPVVMGVDNRYDAFVGTLRYLKASDALAKLLTGKSTCPYGLPVHAFTLKELHEAVKAADAEVEEIFGKPVLFFELLEAMKAARGPEFDAWAARDEITALQERMAHEGFAATGMHLQVMARRKA